MKKLSNPKLTFNKLSITELNDNVLYDINGGSTPLCVMAFIEGVAVSIASYIAVKQLLND